MKNWLVPKLQGGAGKSPLSCEATQCFGHEGDPVIRLSPGGSGNGRDLNLPIPEKHVNLPLAVR